MLNNIENIQNYFVNKPSDTLIINKINEEVSAFYNYTFRYFSYLYQHILDFNHNLSVNSSNEDLFSQKKIKIFDTTSMKKIEEIYLSKDKSIIFTDYKNFKKCQNNYTSINGYNYINDIKVFLKKILKIENESLIEICIKSPQLTYSEVSKYLINKDRYLKDTNIPQKFDSILNIRKEISNLKKTNDIQNLFQKIIDEAKYKKFSFLTY